MPLTFTDLPTAGDARSVRVALTDHSDAGRPRPARATGATPIQRGGASTRLGAAMLAIVALALAAPPAAHARTADQLTVGAANGVHISREAPRPPVAQATITIVFTSRAARLYRRIAGKSVSVLCLQIQDRPFSLGESARTTFAASRRGHRLRVADVIYDDGADFCRVLLEPQTVKRNGATRIQLHEQIVAIPLTKEGAEYLDAESKTRALAQVILLAGLAPRRRHATTWPTPDEILASPQVKRSGIRVVALPGPQDTPPRGSVGYYSDGANHMAVAIMSAVGRRLFVESQGDILSSNIPTNLTGPIEFDPGLQ